MTLVNDLSPFLNKEYAIYSRTAFAHTITIAAGASTWNGADKIATFGGAIGDGFKFRVLDTNLIAVTSNTNVAFS